MNKLETARRQRFRRCGNQRSMIRLRERRDCLLENAEQSLDDLGRRRSFYRMTGPRAHQESFAKRPGKPMGLTASGQLIDRYSAVFLPGASSGDRRCTGGIRRQHFANLAAASDQAIRGETGKSRSARAGFHPSLPSHASRLDRGKFAAVRHFGLASRELLTVCWKHANFSSRKWFDDRTSIYHGLATSQGHSPFTATWGGCAIKLKMC